MHHYKFVVLVAMHAKNMKGSLRKSLTQWPFAEQFPSLFEGRKVGLEQLNYITIVSVWNLPIVKKYGFGTGISPVLRSLSRFLSRWAVQRIFCASVFFVVIISPNNETTTDTSEEFKNS